MVCEKTSGGAWRVCMCVCVCVMALVMRTGMGSGMGLEGGRVSNFLISLSCRVLLIYLPPKNNGMMLVSFEQVGHS